MKQRRPGNTVDSIYQTLRDRIVDGEYWPGMRMSQSNLAAELNISRTPLREALHRLGGEGLVVVEANRGMEVASVSDAQVEQCYALRLLIEPPIIAAITDDVTHADFAQMEDALNEMESGSQRIRDFQEAHLRFHELTLSRYPATVRDLTQSLYRPIYRHQRLHFSRPSVPEHFTRVDRLLLEALRDHKSERARHVLEFHLIDAAVGMILDKNPDHRFDSLFVAARGLGIKLRHTEDARILRPATVYWPSANLEDVVDMSTANLRSAPFSSTRAKKEGAA